MPDQPDTRPPSPTSRLRRWWDGLDGETPEPAPSRTRSVAYDDLVRRQLYADPASLEGAAARLVPSPFQETFEHPRSRIDVDTSWFAADLLGRVGLAVAAGVVFLAVLILALATGVYQPPGGSAGASNQVVPAPRPVPDVGSSPCRANDALC